MGRGAPNGVKIGLSATVIHWSSNIAGRIFIPLVLTILLAVKVHGCPKDTWRDDLKAEKVAILN